MTYAVQPCLVGLAQTDANFFSLRQLEASLKHKTAARQPIFLLPRLQDNIALYVLTLLVHFNVILKTIVLFYLLLLLYHQQPPVQISLRE